MSGIQAALDEGRGINGRGCFVEDHHWRIADGCAGDGEKLTLSLAESSAVASEDGVVTLRQHTDEAVGVGELLLRRCILSPLAAGLP